MSIPVTRRIKLQGRTTQVRMQRLVHNDRSIWRMWISYDIEMKHGTFIEFHDDGVMERVTVNPDGTEDRFPVTLAETVE